MPKLKIAFVVDYLGIKEPLSIPVLSAVAKAKGCCVGLIEFGANPKKSYRQIHSFNPDIIAYSICSNEPHRYLEINSFFKKNIRFYSLFGGPHPTFYPSFIGEDGVDAICRGEGDASFANFLEYFGTEKIYEISNFSFKSGDAGRIISNPPANLIDDLDSLAYPDREIIYSKSKLLAQNPIKVFMAGRGCPYSCSYCFNHAYNSLYKGKGRIVRLKTVRYLLKEIKSVAEKYPLKFVKFHDDIFGIDKNWLVEFSDRYPKEVGLPFLVYARPNIVTEEYCRLLKKAGCYSVSMAIECGNEQLRKAVLNREVTDEHIFLSYKLMHKFGIRIYSLNMIGLPGETEKEIFQTIRMNRYIKPEYSDSSIFQPYPRTQIADYCKKIGWLDKDPAWYSSMYSHTILNISEELKNRIYVLHRLFPILIDYLKIEFLLDFIYRIKWFNNILDLINKLYYGFNLHRRIYASQMPIRHLFGGVVKMIAAKERI